MKTGLMAWIAWPAPSISLRIGRWRALLLELPPEDADLPAASRRQRLAHGARRSGRGCTPIPEGRAAESPQRVCDGHPRRTWPAPDVPGMRGASTHESLQRSNRATRRLPASGHIVARSATADSPTFRHSAAIWLKPTSAWIWSAAETWIVQRSRRTDHACIRRGSAVLGKLELSAAAQFFTAASKVATDLADVPGGLRQAGPVDRSARQIQAPRCKRAGADPPLRLQNPGRLPLQHVPLGRSFPPMRAEQSAHPAVGCIDDRGGPAASMIPSSRRSIPAPSRGASATHMHLKLPTQSFQRPDRKRHHFDPR